MKVLIAYSSVTGNTEKVAAAISKVILNCDLKDISDVETLDYDLIIVGSWIRKVTADNIKSFDFISKIENKDVAFFFTLGAEPDSDHAKRCIENIKKLFTDNNNKIHGYSHCQGAVAPAFIERRRKLSVDHPHGPSKEKEVKWARAALHPNEEDFIQMQSVFKKVYDKVLKLKKSKSPANF